MLKSSGAMGAATFTSRVFGLLREIAYARFMGAGWVADAFLYAFMVPNLFRRLLGEGALTAAFIPIFNEKQKLAGEAEMWRAANAVISGLVVAAVALVALGILGISIALMSGIKDGHTILMLQLLRAMSPYVLLVCLAAVFMGMLNSRGHFFIPAMGATTLNVVMIASVFWLAPWLGTDLHQQIFGLAIGVVTAGIVQAAFQMPLLRREGFRLQWVSPWRDETVRRVVRQMIPGAIGIAAYQINILLTQGFAFWTEKGVVSSFSYAVRFMELPQGVFGISLATYLLPTLSGLAAEKKYPEYRATLGQGLGYLVFVNALASVLLFTLAEPIIRLVYEGGKFHADDTTRSALALACLAPGLVAFSGVNILARAFYALGDTRTPMKISIFCLALNGVFSIALIWRFKQAGLGIANTLSALVNVTLLFYALRRKLGALQFPELRRHVPTLLSGAVLAGAAAWWLAHLWEGKLGHETLLMRCGAVFAPMFAAAGIYFALAFWLKVPYAKEFLALLPAKFKPSKP